MTFIQNHIKELASSHDAKIIAHYYQTTEVKDVADFIGDSLAMAQWAQRCEASTIVVAGVRFMAETAAILVPNATVLSPDLKASCSLAEGCAPDAFAAFISQHPDHIVVTYVNSSVEVKALSDITCTSTNAVEVVNSIPKDQKIIFAPDKNMGMWLRNITGRDILLWDATCEVHDKFSFDLVRGLKTKHPHAYIIAHPECTPELLNIADHIGSTSALLHIVKSEPNETYIVVTEEGILSQMRSVAPNATLIPAPLTTPTSCACGECPHMKLITLQKIERCLTDMSGRITIAEALRQRAELPIQRMMALSR